MKEKKFEYTNICKLCGAENTLWPRWIGRKRVYVCEKCNKISRGITKHEWKHGKKKVGKVF